MTNERAVDRASEIAKQLVGLASAAGASSVVVMVGLPDGGHSAYCVRYAGACLEVRGLVEIGAEDMRRALVFKDRLKEENRPSTAQASANGTG